jgi:hypothetical protein
LFFQLRVINFWDEENEGAVWVYRAKNSTPIVQIQGPSFRQLFSSQSFKLRGDVTLSNCSGNSDTTLSLLWSIQKVVPASATVPILDARTVQTRSLYVAANTLSPGVTYIFQLEASPESGESVIGTETIEIECIFGPLVANIDKQSRTVSAQDDLELDASKSYDLDGSGKASDVPFTYSWSCSTDSRRSCFQDNTGILLQNSPRIVLTSGTLVAGLYTFSVNVTKEPGPRLAQAFAKVWVYPGLVPSVGIRPFQFPVVNPGSRLVLSGMFDESEPGKNISLLWSQIEGDDILLYPALVSTPLTLPSLSIRPGVLTSGQSYSFRFAVTDLGSGHSGFAEISFTVNSAPTSGIFTVSPTAGTGIIDVFTLQCLGWVDNAEDLPITYEFRYIENLTLPSDEIPLGSPDANVYQVTLPAPPGASPSNNLMVVAYITDTWGGQQRSTQLVRVFSPVQDAARRLLPSAAVDRGFAGLGVCEATGDFDCVVRLTVQLARALADSLTCEDKGVMIATLKRTADQCHMNKAEIAAFAEAMKSLSALGCVDVAAVGGRRLISSGDISTSLDLIGTLTSGSKDAGLDPVASKGIGGSLSAALSGIAQKNDARRALRSLLAAELGGGGGDGGSSMMPPAFVRRGGSGGRSRRGDGGGLSGQLLGAIAGLASAQVHGAVTGEDAAGTETEMLRMSTRVVRPAALGAALSPPASDGSPAPAFALPAGAVNAGAGSSLTVQVTGAPPPRPILAAIPAAAAHFSAASSFSIPTIQFF